MATLDQRLLLASQMIIPHSPVADIGTDHARLPLYLVSSGLVPRVIATEWGEGPLQRARQKIENSPWGDRIELRQGNGLEVLKKGEVKTVVIMGLGGDIIADILERDWDLSASFDRLVLQPMTRMATVRSLLAQKGWPLLDEKLARVGRRLFVLLSYQAGSQPYELSVLEKEVGPQILKGHSETEKQYLTYHLHRFKRVCESLALSKRPQNQQKRDNYLRCYEELEEIINAKSS